MDWWLIDIIIIILFAATALLIWLFYGYGIDKLKHPEEWSDAGKAGERAFWMRLTKDLQVPENQILRNVYIPTKNGKTSEIDLMAISKKGIFVFECKNYGGIIYGDARRKNWIQYIGKKKSYFYNPLLQNKVHCEKLKEYLGDIGDVPIISMVGTIQRGNWKVKNMGENDYLLGYNCHFKDVYNSLPICDDMAKYYKAILAKMKPLERPGEEAKQEHIKNIKLRGA